MKIKKVIAVFLLLVLSMQLLPIRQMVSWLVTNQASEELLHADSGKKNPGLDEVHKSFLYQRNDFSINLLISSSIAAQHHAVALIGRHADDIHTPPPNC